MAKNGKSIGTTIGTITVGADIGYGVVKVVTPGHEPVLFPSVWGHSRELKFGADETAAKYPGDQITDDEGEWFVGNLALSQIPAGEQLKLRGRTADEPTLGNVARLRLLKVALGKLFPNQRNGDVLHFKVATGLPVDHLAGSDDLKAAFIGQHIIHTDSTYFVANITDVMVMPQPYGTIYRNTLTPKGEINPCHTFTRTGAIDIGTYTVDLVLDDDGEYIDSMSGSVETGMHVVQRVVAEAYERKFGQKPNYRDIETIIRNRCILAYGEPVDFTVEVDAGLAIIKDAVLTLAGVKWNTGVSVDVIEVAGGGAGEKAVLNEIRRVYRQARLVEDFQLSNAQGYLNYALFTARA